MWYFKTLTPGTNLSRFTLPSSKVCKTTYYTRAYIPASYHSAGALQLWAEENPRDSLSGAIKSVSKPLQHPRGHNNTTTTTSPPVALRVCKDDLHEWTAMSNHLDCLLQAICSCQHDLLMPTQSSKRFHIKITQ